MERIGNIMERMGFNKEADEGVKAAFVKNLIKQAYGVDVPLPPQYEKLTAEPSILGELKPLEPQQLCFNLENTPKVG